MLPMNLHSRVNKQRLETKWRRSFFLRPGGHQRSFTCRAMYHAPILRRDIWDNCFVEVTGPGLASYPPPRSPQADSMVLFGAFCNFLCTRKKKKKKNLFQNDLNECIFVYVHENEAIQKCEQGRLLCWKRREFSVFGGLLCLFFSVFFLGFFLFCFFFLCFFFFLLFYWAFYIIMKNIFY